MAQLTQKQLEKYYDGELSPRKAKWVEKQLETSPEHKAALNKMDRMGKLLCLMAEEKLESVSFRDFQDRVAAGIRKDDRLARSEKMKVWALEFLHYKRVIWMPTAALATAAIAVLITALFVREPVQSPPYGQQVEGIQLMSRAPSMGSTIITVKVGQTEGWKYEVPDGEGNTIGVAWISEKP